MGKYPNEFFDVFQEDIQIQLSTNQQYRGNIFREKVKHCFEFSFVKIISKNPEIGFSNAKDKKNFIGYYGYFEDKSIIRINEDGEEAENIECNMKYEEDSVYQICYDSEKEFLQIFNGKEKCSSKVGLPKDSSWFLYLDHGIGSGTIVSINSGYKNFQNPIPKGYLPWIFPKPILITFQTNSFNFKQLFIYEFLLS